MRQDAIMEGFWIFQDSEHARLPHMRGLHKVPDIPEHDWIMPEEIVFTMPEFWICLIKVSQGFEYVFGWKYARDLNVQGCEYMRVTQGAEYTWISLNIP